MDEDYTLFTETIGVGQACRDAPATTIERYARRLPAKLLEYWAEFGWCAHGDGLFWLTNPEEYEHIIEIWLRDTPLWNQKDNARHVIARTAFGQLYLWGEKTGNDLVITPQLHMIYQGEGKRDRISQGKGDQAIASFLATQRKQSLDFEDEQDKPLFDRALKKLGQLRHDEMYALSLARPLGGLIRLESLQKVDLFVQLDLLRQLAEPAIIRYP